MLLLMVLMKWILILTASKEAGMSYELTLVPAYLVLNFAVVVRHKRRLLLLVLKHL